MIVAIFGQKSNGKTTLAKALANSLNIAMRTDDTFRHSNAFHVASFAFGVKQHICSKYNVKEEDIEFWKNNPANFPGWNCSMRECLQREGQLGREVKSTTWIDKTVNSSYPIVIDDGRYINEATAVMGKKGYNILIVRPSHVNSDQHPSESEIGSLIKSNLDSKGTAPLFNNLFHGMIVNNSSVEDLQSSAAGCVDMILNHFRKGSTHA